MVLRGFAVVVAGWALVVGGFSVVWGDRDHDDVSKKCTEPSLGGLTSSRCCATYSVLILKTEEQDLPICTTLIGAVGSTVWGGMAIGLSIGVAPRRRVVELLAVDLVVRVVSVD